ncbi:MAG: mechanosensitive ion channel family protein [Bdellovibrionales bacterium]|nr:mechanosensitive ion channel family protein [Bdellovibrionales bacterium]
MAHAAWISQDRIDSVVQAESAVVLLSLALTAWIIYRVFMRNISSERHANLSRDFSNLFVRLSLTGICYAAYVALQTQAEGHYVLERLSSYVGLIVIAAGYMTLVKTARVLFYQYLIFWHMRVGVPVLLINIFNLIFAVVLGGWIATAVFAVDLAPLLATSAMLTVVMGLALQDTLGNLFAGIALQFDWKPYEIGDWVEVHNNGQKWLGQVHEISWRATTLLSALDEKITLPNKLMAQSQVNNLSTKERPIIRTQTYRLPFDAPVARVKGAMLTAAAQVKAVRRLPAPLVYVAETTESWVAYRLIYYVDDIGAQFGIADQINVAVLESLGREGLSLAVPQLQVEHQPV